MPLVKYITCSDCNEEWIDNCPVCKQTAWQIKKPSYKRKNNKVFIDNDVDVKEERNYWSKHHPKRVVSLIMKGHEAACLCCHTISDLTFDHIIPLDLGGKNTLSNGQILCAKCNGIKANFIISIDDLRVLVGLDKGAKKNIDEKMKGVDDDLVRMNQAMGGINKEILALRKLKDNLKKSISKKEIYRQHILSDLKNEL